MPQTARGRATREAFEEGARRVIARQGFLRTTVADIAKEAGRSPASFYNYFDSKEALLEALATEFREDVAGRAQPAFRTGTPPMEVVEQSVRAYWTTYKERLAELVGVMQVAMIDGAFSEHWRQIRQPGIDTIAEAIRRAQRKGYAAGLDPQLVASAFGSMLEHFCYLWLAAGGDGSGRVITDDEAVAALSAVWYRTLYWQPEP